MNFWFLALIIPSLAFAFTSTPKPECSTLDLRESLGEVRDQKKVSWCYAFTASDMLGHTFNLPEKVSAADVAIGYNETKIGQFVRWLDVNVVNLRDPDLAKLAHQTGFNKAALITSMKEGWCPENIFPSEVWTKMIQTPEGWVEEQVPLHNAMLEIAVLHAERKNLTPQNLPYYYSFKNVGAAEFIELLQNKKVAGFYSALREAVCRDDRRPFDYRWKVKMVIKNPKIFDRISEQLETGRLVGLDYDSRVLTDNSNHGLNISELHTSSLVARRWNEERKTCEFLVRNSHGNACGLKYDPTIDCDAGSLWLSESQIFKNMTSIVFMLSEN